MQSARICVKEVINRMKTYRPTWAEIDLDAIRQNYRTIKKAIVPSVKVMAIVKANAYGHGSIQVSEMLQRERIFYLGVATLDEAITLRKYNIRAPILILGSIFPHEVKTVQKFDITMTLCNFELLNELNRNKLKAKVHIEIDTGMGRIGVWHENALDFIKKARSSKFIKIEGIYTHFSVAGRDKFFTRYQIDTFEELLKKLEDINIDIPLRHAANSIAVVDWKASHLNLVRPGLIIYGIYPKRNFPKLIKLKPAFSLKTKIAFLKNTPPGRSISYGRTYITQKPTKIATLPIGYADGYGRILSNKAQVLVKGKSAPVVGKVTMDQSMIDVGHIKNVRLGDEVVLIGRQKKEEIRIEKLARLSGTIPYEILTGITSRVPRVYSGI